MTQEKNVAPPPQGAGFWELFDFIWVRGLGNALHIDGTSQSWTATSLDIALGGSPDKRAIENWQSRANIPSPDSLRKLSVLIAGDDLQLRRDWYDALIDARVDEKRREKETQQAEAEKDIESEAELKLELKAKAELEAEATEEAPAASEGQAKSVAGLAPEGIGEHGQAPRKWWGLAVAGALALLVATLGWHIWGSEPAPFVENLRICDAAYFDDQAKKCTKHVDVFVHGIDEVFLSFDFNGVKHGAPFERWWIHNGERIAGRTSFNDEAWPGYTFWRPGVLQLGTYVVRLVVNDAVTTQTFYVQAEGFTSEE